MLAPCQGLLCRPAGKSAGTLFALILLRSLHADPPLESLSRCFCLTIIRDRPFQPERAIFFVQRGMLTPSSSKFPLSAPL